MPEIKPFVRFFFMLQEFNIPPQASSSKPNSTFDREILPRSPLVPRTVVVGEVPVTELVKREKRYRSRHAPIAIGDYRLLPVLRHTRFAELFFELFVGEKCTRLGIHEAVRVEMNGSRYVSGPPLATPNFAGVLTLISGVQDKSTFFTGTKNTLRVRPPVRSLAQGKGRGLRRRYFVRRRAVFGGPLFQPPSRTETFSCP